MDDDGECKLDASKSSAHFHMPLCLVSFPSPFSIAPASSCSEGGTLTVALIVIVVVSMILNLVLLVLLVLSVFWRKARKGLF